MLWGSEVDVFPGNGDGSFGAPTIVPSNGFDGLVAVDLNGDGNVDLATADYHLNAVSAARGNGKGDWADEGLSIDRADGARSEQHYRGGF